MVRGSVLLLLRLGGFLGALLGLLGVVALLLLGLGLGRLGLGSRLFLVFLRALSQLLKVVGQLLLGGEGARSKGVDDVWERDGLFLE